MDQNYLNILEDSLKQKSSILDSLIELSKSQTEVISRDDFELEGFDYYIEKKGELIEKLESLDNGFEELYARVAEELSVGREKYADIIKRMQQLIREITEKSNTVQVQEERNKELIAGFFSKKKEVVRDGRVNTKAAMNYYKVQSNSSFVDSQFMDSKK
jgi:flagellar biosynthesis/type III secretory pathway chaperone